MKDKSIIVTITPDGKVEVTAEGYTGNSCEQATAFVEQALGLDTGKRKKLPSYYAKEAVTQKQRT